jgi:hypothetical protein
MDLKSMVVLTVTNLQFMMGLHNRASPNGEDMSAMVEYTQLATKVEEAHLQVVHPIQDLVMEVDTTSHHQRATTKGQLRTGERRRAQRLLKVEIMGVNMMSMMNLLKELPLEVVNNKVVQTTGGTQRGTTMTMVTQSRMETTNSLARLRREMTTVGILEATSMVQEMNPVAMELGMRLGDMAVGMSLIIMFTVQEAAMKPVESMKEGTEVMDLILDLILAAVIILSLVLERAAATTILQAVLILTALMDSTNSLLKRLAVEHKMHGKFFPLSHFLTMQHFPKILVEIFLR